MASTNMGEDKNVQGTGFSTRYSTIRDDWRERIKNAFPLVRKGYCEKDLYTIKNGRIPVCKNKGDASGLYASCLIAAMAGLSDEDLIARFEKSGQMPDQVFRGGLGNYLNIGGTRLRNALCYRETLDKAVKFLSIPRETVKSDFYFELKITLPWHRPLGSASVSLQDCIQRGDIKGTSHYLDLLDELHVIAGKRGISARDLLKSMKKQE